MSDQISRWKMIKIFFQTYGFFHSIELEFRGQVKEPIQNDIHSFNSFIKFLNAKDLGHLRDSYLDELRSLAHSVFRNRKKNERFDLYISEIFHEFSILKDQKFILEHSLKNQEQISLESLAETLENTYELFKTKLNQITVLFVNAKRRLEEILPIFNRDDLILRNLFLENHKLFKPFYDNPLKDILSLMFLEEGFCKGLFILANSFCQGGFFLYGLDVLKMVPAEDIEKCCLRDKEIYKKLNGFLMQHYSDENLANIFHMYQAEIQPLLKNLTASESSA